MIVGHLPREILRPTKYLLDRGATATITSEDYRKSSLFQGGLEIKYFVTVTLPATFRRHMLLQRYEELVEKLYAEPMKEIIVGSFIAKGNVYLGVPGNNRTLGVETFAWRNFRGKRNARNFVHFAWINFRGWTQ